MSGIDLAELRSSVRDVLAAEATSERLHRFVDGDAAVAAALWDKAASLGWFGLCIAEAQGGLGLGLAEWAVLQEELGRMTAPIPYLTTTLVAEAIQRAGSKAQQATFLPLLAEGALPAALRLPEPTELAELPALSRQSDGGLVLSGLYDALLDGAGAKLLLVEAREAAGALCHILILPETDGATVERIQLVDRTRHLGRLRCDGLALPADRLLPGGGAALREVLLERAALGLACEAAGAAEAIFGQTLDYLKTREQFGRPIGSFQALKHRCADHKVALEASRAVIADAVEQLAGGSPMAGLHASLAKLYGCDVFARLAEDAVQLHGGIGFAWEHSCHLYLKRAKLDQALGGGSAAHADRAARLLLAAA